MAFNGKPSALPTRTADGGILVNLAFDIDGVPAGTDSVTLSPGLTIEEYDAQLRERVVAARDAQAGAAQPDILEQIFALRWSV